MTTLRRVLLVTGLLAALLVVLPAVGGATPPPDERVNETYGGGEHERARTVLATDDGYVLAGTTNSSGAGGTDGWLVRTDARGQAQWTRTHGTAADERVTALAAAPDGGYVLAGTTTTDGGDTDAWVVKVDAEGREQWTRSYGEAGSEGFETVVPAVDGEGYLLAGYTNSTGEGALDAWLVRIDGSGDEQWTRTYGTAGFDSVTDATATGDGYALGGFTDVEAADGLDAWLFETDADGNVTFSSVFGGDGYDAVRAVVRHDGGGYALAAETSSYGSGGTDAWLLTIDDGGQVTLNATYGGSGTEQALGVAETDDGYVLAGLTTAGNGATDALLLGASTDGQLAWNRIVGDDGRDQAWDILVTADGRHIVAGEYGADGWLLTLGGPTPTATATETEIPEGTSTVTTGATRSPTRTTASPASPALPTTAATPATATTIPSGADATPTTPTASGTTATPSGASGAGFGALVALVAGVVALAAGVRRRSR